VFISPGVPEGRQMMRTSYMATHEDEQLDIVISAFKKNGKILGLI
jgi:8-amino-7-oxononanoate synthase